MSSYVLAIDQGTTSSRAIVFNEKFEVQGVDQEEFTQFFPQSGWVEHDPEEIWQTTLATCRNAIKRAGLKSTAIAAIGITNQRETTLIWNRETGAVIHNAIVWQDRRTADYCNDLQKQGYNDLISDKTGLLLDPYFSGTKVRWILENVQGARKLAEEGKLAFGTVDTFLLWKLTGGKVHATDATNASRTLLYNIHDNCWDGTILELFNIPSSLLPEVKNSADDFGQTANDIFESPIKITGIAGDQQAALVGQACFEQGMMKSTYGTGCFAVLNTGETPIRSQNRLLTTIGYKLNGKTTYAIEGSIFIAGAAVQWLRDGLGIITDAASSGELAAGADPNQDVYLVPAFTGLGAPHWDPDARGAIFGLTRATTAAEFCRAALESVCYQTRDLLDAMKRDFEGMSQNTVRVDGGMVASDWTMQFLADILGAPVDRPQVLETTAVGAAYLAGQHIGIFPEPKEFTKNWKKEKQFLPKMAQELRERKYMGWQDAVRRTLSPNIL